jgi:apolipoprotein N-acyltransferase
MRAAEYRVPIFRLTSSGVSQLVDASGKVIQAIPFSEQDRVISGRLPLAANGRLPFDRYLAPVATVLAGLLALWFLAGAARKIHREVPN